MPTVPVKHLISISPTHLLLRQLNFSEVVMPYLIRYPFLSRIPAFVGMTVLAFMIAGVIV